MWKCTTIWFAALLSCACDSPAPPTTMLDVDAALPANRDAADEEPCRAGADSVCVGNELHACTATGSVGDVIETCQEGCVAGRCNAPTECDSQTLFIYVVDTDGYLYSYDPRETPPTLVLVGHLDCPAGPALPEVALPEDPSARPLSMAIDRTGRAWVLYTSGEVFLANTADASCSPGPFIPGDAGFQLFGMGFVASAPGSDDEALYIAGGPAAVDAGDTSGSTLGVIDPTTGRATAIIPLPTGAHEPELTGTGAAELWGYFPDASGTGEVVHLDSETGQHIESYVLPAPHSFPTGWAFAHHGGRFYVFRTTVDAGDETTELLRVEPGSNGTANVDVLLSAAPYKIVGAGVSTCVPVLIP